jgi:hypothetical protein
MGAAVSVALLLSLSTISACGGGFTAAPPVERCGEALYNPGDLPVVEISAISSVTRAEFLEVSSECSQGATVTIIPPTVATIAASIRAKDGNYVIIELEPGRRGSAPTTGTLTVSSSEGLFRVPIIYNS